MSQKVILGLYISNRVQHAPAIQQLLTEYGCYIKTRLGLHETDENSCSPNGLVLLELAGHAEKCQELEDKLRKQEGLQVQKMVFQQ